MNVQYVWLWVEMAVYLYNTQWNEKLLVIQFCVEYTKEIR